MIAKCGTVIIGYGGMGGWHTQQLKTMEEINLLGVYDILPGRNLLAEEKGLHAYSSFEEVLNDPQVDLVTVAIPNDQHRDVCIQAMEAGKNVICEKPVALNSRQLQDMIDASKKNGVLFTVHQNRRWDEDFLTMKKSTTRALWALCSISRPESTAPAGFPAIGATPRCTAAAWCWIGASICWTRS